MGRLSGGESHVRWHIVHVHWCARDYSLLTRDIVDSLTSFSRARINMPPKNVSRALVNIVEDAVLGRSAIATVDIQPGEVVVRDTPTLVLTAHVDGHSAMGSKRTPTGGSPLSPLAQIAVRHRLPRDFFAALDAALLQCGRGPSMDALQRLVADLYSPMLYEPSDKKQWGSRVLSPMDVEMAACEEAYAFLGEASRRRARRDESDCLHAADPAPPLPLWVTAKVLTSPLKILQFLHGVRVNTHGDGAKSAAPPRRRAARETPRRDEASDGDSVNLRGACGVYPVASKFSHSCAANTFWFFDNDDEEEDRRYACRANGCEAEVVMVQMPRVVHVATRPIKAGELVSFSYIGSGWNVLTATMPRRHALSHLDFTCRCARCTKYDQGFETCRSLPCPRCGAVGQVPLLTKQKGGWWCKCEASTSTVAGGEDDDGSRGSSPQAPPASASPHCGPVPFKHVTLLLAMESRLQRDILDAFFLARTKRQSRKTVGRGDDDDASSSSAAPHDGDVATADDNAEADDEGYAEQQLQTLTHTHRTLGVQHYLFAVAMAGALRAAILAHDVSSSPSTPGADAARDLYRRFFLPLAQSAQSASSDGSSHSRHPAKRGSEAGSKSPLTINGAGLAVAALSWFAGNMEGTHQHMRFASHAVELADLLLVAPEPPLVVSPPQGAATALGSTTTISGSGGAPAGDAPDPYQVKLWEALRERARKVVQPLAEYAEFAPIGRQQLGSSRLACAPHIECIGADVV